ncbi:MAG: signal peptidase I, partial [Chloroflexi bacterium]|nr:signal peptidase I [Chloroflexota bacterium]
MNNHHSASGIEETRPAGQRKWSQWGKISKDLLKIISLGFLMFMGISVISARVRVENISMMPTIHPGEFVLVDKLAYKLGGVHHGDIIIFHHIRNQSEGQVAGWVMRTIGVTIDDDYIKRIIGLPGDEIQIQGGKVYINGIPMDEDY